MFTVSCPKHIFVGLLVLALAGCGARTDTGPAAPPAPTPAEATQQQDTPAANATPATPAKADQQDPVQGKLPAQQPATVEDEVKAIVTGYAKATTWRGRFPFVVQSDEVQRQMENRYTALKLAKVDSVAVDSVTPLQANAYRVVATSAARDTQHSFKYYVIKSDGRWCIDWPATAGANVMPIKTFLAQASAEPATFRVWGELASYYNYEFRNSSQTHFSIRLSEEHLFDSLHGYVLKDSDDGRRLFALLKDGNKQPISVEMQLVGPSGRPIPASNHNASITRLVSDSWFIPSARKP